MRLVQAYLAVLPKGLLHLYRYEDLVASASGRTRVTSDDFTRAVSATSSTSTAWSRTSSSSIPTSRCASFLSTSPRDRLISPSIPGYGSHLVDPMRWMGGEFGAVASG